MQGRIDKEPIISIIVPAYNEEKYLEECLTTIKSQSYPNIELIVVDDGSIDTTNKISKKYADRFISQQHQGPAIARNKGASFARGEILVFIDADMFLDKRYIERIIRPIQEGKANATFTKEEYVANANNVWSLCFQIDNGLPYDKRIRSDYPSKDIRFRAIRKDFFMETGGYKVDTGYGEDAILSENESIEVKNAICYHYNPDSLTEVFISSRWIGRSENLPFSLRNILRYSMFNSIRISLKKVLKGVDVRFFIYKIVFDIGILAGVFSKNKGKRRSK